MSADVLLVNLNGIELFSSHRNEGPKRTNPLGILTLAAVCEEAGLRVALRDFTLDWQHRRVEDEDAFLDVLADAAPRADGASAGATPAPVLGIGCDSAFLPFLLNALPRVRARFPDRKIVLGGYGPTMAADAIMRDFPQVDAVVRGEAERVFPEAARRLAEGRPLDGLSGISWRGPDGVHGGGLAPRIEALDDLPMVPWHLVDVETLDEATLMTSRGCPYPCPYCSIRSVWQARNVSHSMDRTMEEIARLRLDYGFRRVKLYDDTFTLDRRRVLEFCRRLGQERLDVEWFCYARIDRVDEALAEAMADAGCTHIRFGIESASNHVLSQIKGGYDAGRALETLRMCGRYFRTVEVNYMYGFPFERWEDFQLTMRAAMDLTERELARITWYRLTLYPMTPIYEKYRAELRLEPREIPDEFRSEWRLLEGFVRRHPELATHYYTVPTPDFARKERAVADFKRWYYRGMRSRDLAAIQAGVALPAPGATAVPVLPHIREAVG